MVNKYEGIPLRFLALIFIGEAQVLEFITESTSVGIYDRLIILDPIFTVSPSLLFISLYLGFPKEPSKIALVF